MNISSILSNDNTTPPPIPGSSENQAGQPEIPNHSSNVDKVSNGISNHYPKISDITNQDDGANDANDGANDANDGANNGASDGASANAQTPVENSSSNHSGPLNEDLKNNEPPSMISSILAEPLENGYISNEDITNNEDLSYYEKNLSTINKLDRFNVKMANINILNHELDNINKIINKSNGISNNYLERLVTEDVATKNNILIPNSKNHTSKEFHWGSSRVKDADYNDSLTSKRTRSATNNKFKQSTNTSKKLLNIAPAPNKKPNAKTKSKSRKVSDSDDSPSSKRFKTSESPIDNSSGKVKLKLTLKNQDAKKRKVQEDKARELIRQQELEKQKENHKQKQVSQTAKNTKEQKVVTKQYDNTYVAIWKDMSRKDGPKVSRLLQQSNQAKVINLKKTAILAAREAKRWQLRNNKNQKDLTTKARRAMREMFNFWKRNERVERELRKKHEKELLDKAKREEEDREAKRQSRKLNFLITQTELYSHFIGKKIKTDEIEGSDADPRISNAKNDNSHFDKYHGIEGQTTDFNSIDFDNDDEEALNRAAAANAQVALEAAQTKARGFDSNHNQDLDLNGDPLKNPDTNGEEMNFQNPTLMGDITITQPDLLKCSLKEYQIKGLNWLANLYEQGINGILADEMGLGKTVQSISVLAYLAEHHNIWGPFLVVTPASTLHNWQQEITKFVPDFKVLPYWGNAKDRKVLRKFWDRKSMRYGKDAPFHVLVTSYQLVVADAAYFQKMKWQYMILDEAQAIKSSQSSRWKSLLSFSSRNRLLLTGTPIQNSMQELWALLHFIMPSLFDSHDEFSDWFSKDIESHAQSNTKLNEQQLKRLHVILKPFMLRRIKKNVQSELGDKVEIDLFCDLTNRQKKYYQMLKSQISIMDILDTTNNDDSQSLMNLVMQFRKVCNHPDLFERADVKSSLSLSKFAETSSFLRESNELELKYSTENLIRFNLPRLIYDEILLPNYDNNVGSRNKISEMFNIYHPSNVNDDSNKTFDWLRFVDKSPQELNSISHQNLLERAIDHQSYNDSNYDEINRLKYVYDEDDKFIPVHKKLLINDYNNNSASISNSVHMKELYSIQTKSYEDMYLNVLPPAAEPVATAAPITLVCHEASFPNKWHDSLFDEKVRSALMPLSLESELSYLQHNQPIDSYPKSNMLPRSTNKLIDYSNIRMPSMTRFITESGKLATLDKLLVELKQNDHRVLVYFQMTKMMDLMEEYLSYRQHKYIRLDGSSKLDDRRDLVHDWQTKPEIFVFLLSTRAGGLGINLTAADTVIFYDSDWNPTIDSQAMDRAHRLGQTKQVTVYRLLARGTIEERMRDRAKQKEQVQQVVMEGKSTLVNKKEEAANKKKDVAFLLLGGDDDSASNSSIQPDSSDKKTVESANDSESNLQDNGNDSKESLDKNLAEMYHEDEGEFSKNPSGTVTPGI